VNLLCPACHSSLPAAATPVVICPTCEAEIDLSRAGTAVGRPRYVPEPDRSGRAVGAYELGARLGGGGMGTVYRATDGEGRSVAVKFLSPALAGTPELVARFGREVKLLLGLDHPAIVRVLGQGDDEGVPWFAMELVEGEDLRARLQRGRPTRAETLAIFERLLAALQHAHDRGIIHRDLKPANVLLAPAGAKLADFGVARWEAGDDRQAATRLTETAAVIGTLPYMSPEQRRGGPVERRSDLFSAGVLLYECITGSVPQGAFRRPSQLNAEFPRALDRLVLALLAPDPERRPASAEEARRSLLAALAPRQRRGLFAAGGAATLALGGVLAVAGGWFGSGGAPLVTRSQVNGPVPAPAVDLPPPPPQQAQAPILDGPDEPSFSNQVKAKLSKQSDLARKKAKKVSTQLSKSARQALPKPVPEAKVRPTRASKNAPPQDLFDGGGKAESIPKK
jgi:serine/threonine protein kinase